MLRNHIQSDNIAMIQKALINFCLMFPLISPIQPNTKVRIENGTVSKLDNSDRICQNKGIGGTTDIAPIVKVTKEIIQDIGVRFRFFILQSI